MSLKSQPRTANNSINETPSDSGQPKAVIHRPTDEQRWDSIPQENLLSIYFTLDSTGVVLGVNPVGAAGLEYTVEDLIEQSIFSFFHPEDRARLQAKLSTLAQHPVQVVKGMFRLLTKDGSSLLVKVTAQALQGINVNTVFLLTGEGIIKHPAVETDLHQRESDGCSLASVSPVELLHRDCEDEFQKPAQVHSDETCSVKNHVDAVVRLGRDFTGQKQAEQSLTHQKELLQIILDHAPVLLALFDSQGQLQWTNRACEQTLGWKIEELQNRDILDEVYPDPQYRQSVIDFIESATEVWGDFKTRVQDGRVVNTTWANVRLSDGSYIGIGQDITKRKQAEDALRQSEDQLLCVLQNMPVMMNAFDANWNIIIWNRECERVTGYSAQEIVGNPQAMELLYPDRDYRQEMIAAWAERGNDYRDWEWEVTCKDGSVKIIAWSNLSRQFPIPGWAAWGVGVDVTERKRAEEALQQQILRERLLGAIAQRIRQSLNLEEILNTTVTQVRGFLATDRVLLYRVWSNGTGSVVTEAVVPGYPAVLGQTFPEEVFPQESHQLYCQGRTLAIDDIEQAEILPCLADFVQQFGVRAKLVVPILQGEQLWGLLIAHQCRDSRQWQPFEIELLKQLATQLAIAIQQSKLFQQVQGLNADLERQVQSRTAQLQLAFEFEATLKRITDRVRDSLDEGQILQTAVQELAIGLGVKCCNTALYDLDQGSSTICYEYASSLSPSKGSVTKMINLPDIYAQLLHGQCFQFCSHFDNLAKDHVAILVCPIFDNQGVIGDLWLVNHKYYAFHEQDIRLVQQVANQCAIGIRQARLYQAAQAQVEELEKLNHLKDDFLSTVSHELRTPVCNIKMAAQMLEIVLEQEGILDTQANTASRYFQILQDECRREINLINNLLDLSRLEAGTEPLILTTIDPRIWILSIAEPFVELAESQQQQLQIDIPSTLPALTTDLSDVERILTEVLNNACKYTPSGGRITVSAQATAKFLQLCVSNSGIEIPKSELTHIFDKFYRVPNNDPWKHGGTGLGLALVKKLIEQLQGTIQVDSSTGQTTFTLQFPLKLVAV